MAKTKWKLSGSLADQQLEGDEPYDGDTPTTNGVYTVKLQRLTLADNSSGDPMLKTVTLIAAPKGDKKAPFNGYPVFGNWNITESGARWTNALLDAVGLSKAQKRAFWSGKVVVDSDGNVVSLGGKKISYGVLLRVFCKYDREYENLKASQFLPGKPSKASSVVVDDDDDEEEEEDDAADLDEDDEDEEEEEEEDDDEDEEEEEDEDDEDDEDDDEPEPPKKSKGKTRPAARGKGKSSAKSVKAKSKGKAKKQSDEPPF